MAPVNPKEGELEMFDKFRRGSNADSTDTESGTDTRTAVLDRPARSDAAPGDGRNPGTTGATTDTRESTADTRDSTAANARQPANGRTAPAAATARTEPATDRRAAVRERFGGADGTAIFFGWLSALGLAALLLAVVGAAGTRLGFATNVSTSDATNNAGTLGIVGAAIIVVVLLLAYYCGGYVAGRMARFDGGRQGFRVWLLGLLVTIAAAVAGWIGGSQYNIYQQLNLPRIPVKEGDIVTGAIITLVVVLVGTLLASVAGGKAGERYHARIDAAWDRAPAANRA